MNLDEFTKLIAVLYLFLGGLLTAVFAYSQVRNKNNAEAIQNLTVSVVNLNQEISALKKDYDAQLAEKETEIDRLKVRVRELEREVDNQRRPGG